MSVGDWDMAVRTGIWLWGIGMSVGDCLNYLTQCGKTQLESEQPIPCVWVPDHIRVEKERGILSTSSLSALVC